MISTLAVGKRINRLYEETERRRSSVNEGNNFNGILANNQPHKKNFNGPVKLKFYFNHKTLKSSLYFSTNGNDLLVDSQQFLHPFISLQNFGIHLYGTKDRMTNEIIGGLQEESRQMLLEFVKQGKNKGNVTMSLLSNIKCEGSTEVGIEPFDIKCNRQVPRNCKDIEMNQVYDCLLYTSPSPRDGLLSRMPSSA